VPPNPKQPSDILEKKELAIKLATQWSYSAEAIFGLLNWLDTHGGNWRQPQYVLKMVRDSEIDLDELL